MSFTRSLFALFFLLSFQGLAAPASAQVEGVVALPDGFQFVSPPPTDLEPLERLQARNSQRRLERGLLLGGGLGLLASYLVNAGVGALASVQVSIGWGPGGGSGGGTGSNPNWDLFRVAGLIPVLGPWIQLGLQPTAFSEDDWGPFLVTTGLLQAVSLVLLIAGVAVRVDEPPIGNLQVTPWADTNGAGLMLSGAF